MIDVQEARSIIEGQVFDFGIESIPLDESLGRILREPIATDRDMPPYDRVTMDGIAITYARYEKGQRSFKIAGVAAAGDPVMHVDDPEVCIEIMTGAIMATGVDSVVPYEKVEIKDGVATIIAEGIKYHRNIHFKGEDRKAGDIVLAAGTQISSVDIGVCASVGKSQVEVSQLPKSIVISTGDELVEIEDRPKEHQVRKSNVFRIKNVLEHYKISVDTAHLLDDMDEIVPKLEQFVADYELIILSGGVSKGKFDYLPEALEKVGVVKLFHRVKQRPGKPFWFGRHSNGAVVFALPGNPVSSFMCTQNYFKFWLEKCVQHAPQPQPFARLTEDYTFDPDLTLYLQVRLDFSPKGEILAHPIRGNGSGDFASLVGGDAFIELPRGANLFKKGESYPIIRYRESLF